MNIHFIFDNYFLPLSFNPHTFSLSIRQFLLFPFCFLFPPLIFFVSVCLSLFLSVCLSLSLPVSVSLSLSFSVYPFLSLSLSLSIPVFLCMSVCLSFFLSSYLFFLILYFFLSLFFLSLQFRVEWSCKVCPVLLLDFIQKSGLKFCVADPDPGTSKSSQYPGLNSCFDTRSGCSEKNLDPNIRETTNRTFFSNTGSKKITPESGSATLPRGWKWINSLSVSKLNTLL